jgi:uncharacterized protein YfaS (alpha-2-macroglobulin family)
LEFNQEVDPATVGTFLSLSEATGNETTYPPFEARRPTADELKKFYDRSRIDQVLVRSVLISPRQPLKKGSRYVLHGGAGLRGSEGPLGMSVAFNVRFTTFNELTLLGLRSSTILPTENVVLQFSNPVSEKEVLRHLTIESVVTTPPGDGHEYYQSEIALDLSLEADRQYRGTISAGLKDKFGNELAQDAHFEFRTISFRPVIRMTTGEGVLEAYEAHRYPIVFTNIDSVRLKMGKLDVNAIIPTMSSINFSNDYEFGWEDGYFFQSSQRGEKAEIFNMTKTWYPRCPRNEPTLRPINLDTVLGAAKRGVVMLQVDNLLPANRHRFYKALVQVTDFGITSKFSPESNLIWVTMLRDVSPVSGASVELRNDANAVLWKGTTNDKGLVKTPGWGALGLKDTSNTMGEEEYEYRSSPHIWVIVTKGDDVAFTSSNWNTGISPWQFDIDAEWNPQFEPPGGLLFTDRGLYKAGEEVDIKAIMRNRRDGIWRIPTRGDVRLSARNARDEEIYSQIFPLSIFGSAAASIALKPNAPLGDYPMKLEFRPDKNAQWKHVASGHFSVEAFRPAEFDVTAGSDRKEYTVGDTVSGYFSAKYLFGAAMKGEKITWRLSASPSHYSPPGFDGYFFGPMGWLSHYSEGYGYRMLSSQGGSLDEFGNIRVSAALRVGELRGSHSVLFEGDVTSPSRQVISGRTSVLVHGGEFYIGVSPSATFVKTDSALAYKITAVTPDGKTIEGCSLSVKVFQRIWQSVRKSETGGRYAWESWEVDSLFDSTTVVTTSTPTEKSFTPHNSGFYFFVVEGTDRRGNRMLTNAYFYASGRGYVAWKRENDDRIELVANKMQFKPGETASIIVKSPYESAPALVSIEREGIIRHYTTTLVGSAPQIDIPIEKDFLPNIFVSVVLLQGRVESISPTKEADIGRPSFKIGYIKLSVSPLEKMLSVEAMTDSKEYRPGDSVEVSFLVKGANGKGVSSEVTLSVADLGVLNLIGYRLPNPFTLFYAEKALAVTTAETRLHLVQQRDYGEKGEDEGGGGAAETMSATVDAEGVRKDFRASAYWNPSIITNKDGKATVKFKLPDNLTSFEIMAVAHTPEAEFGYGENSITVNKPLLLQPSLPRFARVGDTFEGGVVLFNYTTKEKTVTVEMHATGITLKGDSILTRTLSPGKAMEIRQPFLAEKVGKAVFVFRAHTDEDRDGAQWTIPIQVPRLAETVALYETTTENKVQERVIIPNNIFQDIGEVEVSAASTAMVGLSGGMSYLFSYPYGCLEQRLSAVLPIILAKDLVEAFKFEVFKDKDYRQVVAKTLDEVPMFQRANGGFSYWKNTDDTWPYLSAYAMYALTRAQQNGYTVDTHMMDEGFRYLQRVLHGEAGFLTTNGDVNNCTRALVLYTLALGGKPDFGYMERLYNERNNMPLLGKAYLLKALDASNGNQAMIDELVRDLMNLAKIAPTSVHFEERNNDDYYWFFSSDAHTTALILQALIETQPENPLIHKTVRWLLDQRKNGCWRTTQENLFIVDALATYFKVYEKESPNFIASVQLAGNELVRQLFVGRSLQTVRAQQSYSSLSLGATYPVDFMKDGTGRLYYGLRMKYYLKEESKAKEEGFAVVKTIESEENPGKPLTTIKAGSILKVTLQIATNQTRNFVVVDDPVPAGLEIINTSFQTTANNLSREGNERSEYVFSHRELKDDRVLLFANYMRAGVHTFTYLVRATSFGTFAMPSTRAEGMYEPEVFGQTASKTIVIE